MSLTDLSVVVSQIALPVGLLIWLARWPARDTLSYIVRTGTTALYLVALCLVPIWLVLPWWTPWVYFVAAMALVAGQAFRGRIPVRHRLPRTRFGWIGTLVFSLYAIALAAVCFHAISGRAVPDDVVDLAFPMGTGTYLVASGGSTRTVNGHLATLDPQTDRQRAYRGQSYAVDLIKLNDLGLHALGWRPEDPSAYAIFGEPVLAPCAGKVLAAHDGNPDMPVPKLDTSRLEGNHVFLDCGEFGALLAHFRQGSLRVGIGDDVESGELVGEVGNSGQSAEPHLHVHAQAIPAKGPLLSGDPVFITLDGRFLVRNDLVTITPQRGSEAPR